MLRSKILNIRNRILLTYTTLNAKINEVKKKIPSITNLATATTALTTVENKIPNVLVKKADGLVKKADYDAKISEMENKYFTTPDYNKFTSNTLDAKITQKKLVNEYDLNKKTKTLATKEDL